MGTVAFIPALVAFTASIYLASAGCGSIPTSKDQLVSFYLGTKICNYENLERVFSENKLLVNCTEGKATISTERVQRRTRLFAVCENPNDTCLEKSILKRGLENAPVKKALMGDMDLLHPNNEAVITLPPNSTDCIFGACSFGGDDTELIYINISKCAETTTEVTEYTTVVPTNASTAPQATMTTPQGTMPAPQATMTAPQATMTTPQATMTAPQATTTAPQATSDAIISSVVTSVVIAIFVAVVLILVLVVTFNKRKQPALRHWIIFPSKEKFDVTFEPVAINDILSLKVTESHESIFFRLYEHNDFYAPNKLEGVPRTTNDHYQTSNFSATRVSNESLALEGVGSSVTRPSVVGNHYCQLGDSNALELEQSSYSDPSDSVMDGFENVDEVIEEVEQRYVTNERSTDNLPSGLMLDACENINTVVEEVERGYVPNERSTDNLPSSGLVMDGFKYLDTDIEEVECGYITNEPNTDNLPSSGLVMDGFKYLDTDIEEVERGYITNEPNTDNLPSSDLVMDGFKSLDTDIEEVERGYITNEPNTDNLPSSDLVMDGFKYLDTDIEEVERGYITNEPNTDNLAPVILAGLNVDCESGMPDEDNDRSLFMVLGDNQDILNSGKNLQSSRDSDLTEHVQDNGALLFLDNVEDPVDFFMPQYTDQSDSSSSFVSNDDGLYSQNHNPHIDSHYCSAYV